MASGLLSALLIAVLGGGDCTVLQFSAHWCEPCRQIQPAMDQLAQDGFQVRKVNADLETQLVAQFQIENLPTLVFVSGGREVDRIVGVTAYDQLRQRADRVAARSGSRRPDARPANSQALTAQSPPQPIVRGQSPITPSFAPSMAAANRATAQLASASQALNQLASGVVGSGVVSASATSATSLTPEQAISRAGRATVRIRVDEANTTAFGTGTIVDVHGDEALVLTCGHLFREMLPASQLTVDLFAGSAQEINVPAQLIDFKAEEADIGLIAFRLPVAIEPVDLSPRGHAIQVGQPAFSFGCDHGADPTRRDTRVKSINRYIGADNIEIFGAPAVGRSGGGLFDLQGRLIGVCNAADAQDDEGIYAAANVIYEQIERLGLSHLFSDDQPSVQFASGSNQHPNSHAENGTSRISPSLGKASRASQSDPEFQWPDELAGTDGSNSEVAPDAIERLPPAQPKVSSQAGVSPPGSGGSRSNPTASGQQLIVIVRDANGQDRVMTIDRPSAELLRQIESDSAAR